MGATNGMRGLEQKAPMMQSCKVIPSITTARRMFPNQIGEAMLSLY
jgi:hypothetical protein